jgi:hypothetical protein
MLSGVIFISAILCGAFHTMAMMLLLLLLVLM